MIHWKFERPKNGENISDILATDQRILGRGNR